MTTLLLRMLLVLVGLLVLLPITDAAARKSPHVVIRKQAAPPPIPTHPIAIPLAVVPPLLVFYDLQRRVNCLQPPDPLGLGGPGFDGKPLDPAKGNVMIPCWQRQLQQ